MDKHNISRDIIAEAIKSEFGFNRKLCLDIVNDIIVKETVTFLLNKDCKAILINIFISQQNFF